jgi:hypothetical protein
LTNPSQYDIIRYTKREERKMKKTIIVYWLNEYAKGNAAIVRQREEDKLYLYHTNIKAFMEWLAEVGIEFDLTDMKMWEASFK